MKNKKNNKMVIKGYFDIITYSILIIFVLIGFVAGYKFAKVCFWIMAGTEVSLLMLNWILIILAPDIMRLEIGLDMLKKIGTLRTSNHIVTLIFKVPIILTLIFLSGLNAALALILTIFFEEHRILLIEREFFNLKNIK